MARRLRDILDDSTSSLREMRPGVWASARPLVGPLRWRLRDAWLVLTGKADAVTWPTPDDPSSWCAVSAGPDRVSIATKTGVEN